MTNIHVTIEDIAVMGGLAALFCWTYIFLPLAFYHS
jgi:hypothetical protein